MSARICQGLDKTARPNGCRCVYFRVACRGSIPPLPRVPGSWAILTPASKIFAIAARAKKAGAELIQHADVLVISSAWLFRRVEHFRILATARAIENQSYVIVVNRVGIDAGVTFCGMSAIIDPYGVVIASAFADRDEIVYADLSSDVLQSVWGRMPVFTDRRRDLYSTWPLTAGAGPPSGRRKRPRRGNALQLPRGG